MKEEITPALSGQTLAFAQSVAHGLSNAPRSLDCRYIYDAHGSRLFEQICDQPEYYLTRAEHGILLEAADEIARLTGPASLVEFGSGNSAKTRILLNAYGARYGAVRYIPVDISDDILEQAQTELAIAAPAATVEPFHGSYDEAFHLFDSFSPVVFLFLGSNLGNLDIAAAADFWTRTSAGLPIGDFCLLGIDTTEDADALHAAYNDAAGYSAEFTKNIFSRMNRELGASIDVGAIEHVTKYSRPHNRIEIYAKFNEAQKIDIAPLGHSVVIGEEELVLTEFSHKYRVDEMIPYLQQFRLQTEHVFNGADGRFAVLLLRRMD